VKPRWLEKIICKHKGEGKQRKALWSELVRQMKNSSTKICAKKEHFLVPIWKLLRL